MSLLPGTKRSSTGSELPFTSLDPLIHPRNFKLKQTVHCLSITSEHQQLFTWVGRQARASPITSLKTQQRLDHPKVPNWRLSVHLLPWEVKAQTSDSFGPENSWKTVWGLEVSKQMSHTPILVFCLGSWPLFPLGGGNVAALQHEGRVGARRVLAGGRKVRLSTPGRPPPVLEGLGSGGTRRWRRRRRALDGQRDSLHCPCCAEAAREVAPGARTARAQAAVAGVLGTRSWGRRGRGQRPRRDSRAPGGRPRDQGGDPAPQAGANRARRDPEGGSGVLGRRKLVPGRLGSRLVLSTPVASSQGRPREGRISGAAAEAPGGRGGGGGRLARRLGERPGGPGLGPPQPPPLAAGETRSGCDRRGRKLSDLASADRKSVV